MYASTKGREACTLHFANCAGEFFTWCQRSFFVWQEIRENYEDKTLFGKLNEYLSYSSVIKHLQPELMSNLGNYMIPNNNLNNYKYKTTNCNQIIPGNQHQCHM